MKSDCERVNLGVFLCVTIVGMNDGDECVQPRVSDREQKSV